MRKYILLLLWLTGGVWQVYSQQQAENELKRYNDYVVGLPCYKTSSELTMTISQKFMEGDIPEVRRLSAEREMLLMQSIDSVQAYRPDARKSEAAAQMVCRLAFNLGFENIGRTLEQFDPGFNPACLQEMRSNWEKEKKVRPGMPAADFKVFDKTGKEYTLDSFKGKYIFLEFSASWCSWCKKEIPAIRKAYEQFKDQVVFITIHLDDNKDKWLKDLETHQVPWYCLSDLQAWKSPMAKAYNISGVPNCFIIGPDRLIKAKELRGVEIMNKLQELISGKDGIHFYTTDFQEALQQSKKSGKLIFMDCYTSWCAPCKMMNTTVYTDPEVGHFFNEHFVNIKFDMEKGEGRELSKRYKMQVFPTYLLLDAEGNEVHRVVGGHDATEFIDLIKSGMQSENSIAGMQKRFESGERTPEFLRKYIEVLGGGYRFDCIPEVLDALCRQNKKEISETDWQLMRRFLSDPSSYAFRYAAENRKQLQKYVQPEDLEAWIQKVLYVPIFNAVNEAVFDEKKHDAARLSALREDVKVIKPVRAAYLQAILDYYDAYHQGKMKKVLSIYRKQFMNLPGEDRFGLTMQLNAMLYAKGSKTECKEGLRIFHQIFNPADPILKNFENSLNKKINQ